VGAESEGDVRLARRGWCQVVINPVCVVGGGGGGGCGQLLDPCQVVKPSAAHRTTNTNQVRLECLNPTKLSCNHQTLLWIHLCPPHPPSSHLHPLNKSHTPAHILHTCLSVPVTPPPRRSCV